eukprot:9551499-Ditylum_brightwellii.AAC.1
MAVSRAAVAVSLSGHWVGLKMPKWALHTAWCSHFMLLFIDTGRSAVALQYWLFLLQRLH